MAIGNGSGRVLSEAEHRERSIAGHASAIARHHGAPPSVRQGSTSEPSRSAISLFRQGAARTDTRARRGPWDTRATEAPVGALNARFTFHFPKAYRSKTPDPKIGGRPMLARTLGTRAGEPGTGVVITNPKTLVEAHRHAPMRELVVKAIGVVRDHQKGAIEKATKAGLIPEGTAPGLVSRAYKHAALLALHKAGLGDYDFGPMEEATKAEFRPLVPFMRYANRRVFDQLNVAAKGAWVPFRDEFGVDYRQKKFGQETGVVRRRMRPNQEFIKIAIGDDEPLEKAFARESPPDSESSPPDSNGRKTKLQRVGADKGRNENKSGHNAHSDMMNLGRLTFALAAAITRLGLGSPMAAEIKPIPHPPQGPLPAGSLHPGMHMRDGIAVVHRHLGLTKFDPTKHKRDKDGRWSAGKIGLATGGAYAGGSLAARYGGDAVALATGRHVAIAGPKVSRATIEEWRAGSGHLMATGMHGEGSAKAKFVAGMAGLHTKMRHLENAAASPTEGGAKPSSVWRGMHGSGAKHFLNAKPGDHVSLRAPTSWSRDSSVASHFTRWSYTGKAGGGPRRSVKDLLFPDPNAPPKKTVRPGTEISQMVGGPNVEAKTPRVRVHLRGLTPKTHAFDVEHHVTIPGPQQETFLGAGSKVRIDKVRSSKSGAKVIHATLVHQSPRAAVRRAVVRRLLSPSFHAGRIAGRLSGAITLGGIAALGAMEFREAREKKQAARKDEPLDGLEKLSMGFTLPDPQNLGDYNTNPATQLRRAMHPRIRRRLPHLRLNTQRHLRRVLNGGVTRQERWQLGASMRPPRNPFGKRAPTHIDVAAASAVKPMPGQIEAGNYRKGHARVGGLDVTIETAKGGTRSGIKPNGHTWSVKMPAHYGYIRGTTGADGDHVDVYLGPLAHEAEKHSVFVVDQQHADTHRFDEHKAFVGFADIDQATKTYDAAFSDKRGPERRRAIHTMTFPAFRRWVGAGDTTKALKGQALSKGIIGAAMAAGRALGAGARVAGGALGAGARATGAAIGRTSVARRAMAVPRIAGAVGEAKAIGLKGTLAPLHAIGRIAGHAAAGARGAKIGGGVGLAGDYAPVAYTAGSAGSALFSDKESPEQRAAKRKLRQGTTVQRIIGHELGKGLLSAVARTTTGKVGLGLGAGLAAAPIADRLRTRPGERAAAGAALAGGAVALLSRGRAIGAARKAGMAAYRSSLGSGATRTAALQAGKVARSAGLKAKRIPKTRVGLAGLAGAAAGAATAGGNSRRLSEVS